MMITINKMAPSDTTYRIEQQGSERFDKYNPTPEDHTLESSLCPELKQGRSERFDKYSNLKWFR
jgi:hypothetical protein